MKPDRLLVLACLTLAALPAIANPPEQKTSAKGLTYSIRIPDGYVKGKSPLVVALHGAGDNCQNFMRWITGKAFAKSSEWKKWVAENAKK
jgi:poly(3-hydroxybutyrate) depolymerase